MLGFCLDYDGEDFEGWLVVVGELFLAGSPLSVRPPSGSRPRIGARGRSRFRGNDGTMRDDVLSRMVFGLVGVKRKEFVDGAGLD